MAGSRRRPASTSWSRHWPADAVPDHAAPSVPAPLAAAGAWRPSRIVLVLGMGLTLLVVAALAWVGHHEYRGRVRNVRAEQALMARVLEDHATLSADTAALALATAAGRIEADPRRPPAALAALLREVQTGLPFLRGVALVDARGAIVVSTIAGDVPGTLVDLQPLGAGLAPGQVRLGRFVPGRGLGALARNTGERPAVPPGIGFIPLVRGVALADGVPGLLVGVANPDAFSNYQTLTLGDGHAASVLADYSGRVLAATAGAGVVPGAPLAEHPVFHEQLLAREHGAYEGRGAGGEAQIVTFRASRKWPLMVVVEHPLARVQNEWWAAVQPVLWVCGAAVLLLAAMTLVAWHGLRTRERTRALLDRTQAEVAQRERELRVTVRSVQELIFRTDAAGRITYVNPRWEAFGGTAPAKALGVQLSTLVEPEHRATMQALFSDDPGQGFRSAQVAVRVAGASTDRLLDVAVVPLVQDGRVTGFAGSAVDVTERVTAQRRLQTQLAITELILETSPLPLSVRDLQGRYVHVNQAWEEFTGMRRNEVLGRSSAPGLRTFEDEQHRTSDVELRARGGRLRYEANVVRGDGVRRDVVMDKRLMPGDGAAPTGILSVMVDVSEFRAAERATREARDVAEEASRAKSEFIANISHELRTPLQSILGFSELGTVRGRDQPKLAAMFDDIHRSGRRMLALVNDLLDVAKLESAVGTFHLERADLRPLVREVVHELEPLLADKSLHLGLSLSSLPLIAKVDPLRFQQVVRNVLANAIRFSPAHGRIVLEGSTTPQAEILLRIADQGPGIPPDELDRIFEAFVQSSGTNDGSGGTGLGLTICRKILDVHGGRIAAMNRPGGGAEFHIHLPAKASFDTVPMGL